MSDDPFEGCEAGEFNMACSVEHHFTRNRQPIIEAEYEEMEKQRLLQIPKHKRTLWCWVCGHMTDPCDYPTPKEGVEAHERHVRECVQGSREADAEVEAELRTGG